MQVYTSEGFEVMHGRDNGLSSQGFCIGKVIWREIAYILCILKWVHLTLQNFKLLLGIRNIIQFCGLIRFRTCII